MKLTRSFRRLFAFLLSSHVEFWKKVLCVASLFGSCFFAWIYRDEIINFTIQVLTWYILIKAILNYIKRW